MGIQLILNENEKHGVPVKVYTKDIAPEAIEQLRNMAKLEFVLKLHPFLIQRLDLSKSRLELNLLDVAAA